MKFNLAFAPIVDRLRSVFNTDRLRFALIAAGWPGIVGLLLFLGGAVGHFLVVPQQQATAASAKGEAERNHQDYSRLADGGRKDGLDAGDGLTHFRELLTAEKKADEAMEIIQRDAQKNGLALAGTEYKWQRQPNAKLAEVHIAMPVKAGYAPLRAFVKDVLVDVPGLALEQFELQRDNIGNTNVDARLRFSLFLKAGS
jgi:hypothetical protein